MQAIKNGNQTENKVFNITVNPIIDGVVPKKEFIMKIMQIFLCQLI